MTVRLDWDGRPERVERVNLPFQTVERINEARATRERDRGALFGGNSGPDETRNLLAWGDNKLVMGSLLRDHAGRIKVRVQGVVAWLRERPRQVRMRVSRPGRVASVWLDRLA